MNNKLKNLIKGLVDIKTYSGYEEEGIKFLKKEMVSLGYDDVHVCENGSLIGYIYGYQKGKTILFDGHIDTVKVEEEKWSNNPFECGFTNEHIIGRGVSDMKSALCSAIYSASLVNKDELKGTIAVSATVYEEIIEGVAFKEVLETVKPDLVVICEASELNLNIGQRGRCEIILEIFGKCAHSSNPNMGINSIEMATLALNKINKEFKIKKNEVGESLLVVTDIISSPYPGESVIPNKCTITFDRRIVLGEDEESILGELDLILKEIEKLDSNFKYNLKIKEFDITCYTGKKLKGKSIFLPWFNNNERLIKQLSNSLMCKKIENCISTYNFCTNGSESAGRMGIPTIGYGPGKEEYAHIDNEYIEIKSVDKSVDGYLTIIDAYL